MKYLIYFIFLSLIIGFLFYLNSKKKKKFDKEFYLPLILNTFISLAIYLPILIIFKMNIVDSFLINLLSLYISFTINIYPSIKKRSVKEFHFSSILLLIIYLLVIILYNENNDTLYFNYVMFITISIILLIPYFYFKKKLYSKELDFSNKFEFFIKLIGLTMLVSFLVVSLLKSSYYYLKFPLNYDDFIIAKNPYALLFEGFQDGHLYLKIIPDERLALLKNPYAGRPSYINYLWDFAYFNKHYYVYFGVAPVLLIYYPIYFLSFGHYIPQYDFVNNICAIACVIYSLLAMFRVYKHFSKKFNPLLFILCALTLFVGGGYLYLALAEPMYNTPILFATMAMYSLIYYCFKGIEEKSKLSFALMGFSFIVIMTSRPNLSLAIIPLLAILLPYLLKNFKKNVFNFIPCFIILILGFIGIGLYNYNRFGSFIDFGANYQLTVSDVSKNKILLENFKPAMFYYLFQPFEISKTFPYLKLVVYDIKNFNLSHYTYSYRTFGIFMIPISLFIFVGLFNRKNKQHIIFNILTLLFMIILAFLDFSLAGVHTRYVMDIYPFIIFVAICNILIFNDLADKIWKKKLTFLISFALIVVSFGIFFNILGSGSYYVRDLYKASLLEKFIKQLFRKV